MIDFPNSQRAYLYHKSRIDLGAKIVHWNWVCLSVVLLYRGAWDGGGAVGAMVVWNGYFEMISKINDW